MPSTPPPTSARAHTPPAPQHGSRYDNWEPYSPRRSKRTTAHTNPYSSFNSERPPHTRNADASTPPPTVKRTRFGRAPAHAHDSPLTSPELVSLHPTPQTSRKTPRKQTFTPVRSNGSHPHAHSSASRHPTTMHPVAMLPTPSKTPKKQPSTVASTARILNFQTSDPNDAMPTPRRITKHRAGSRATGFELYDEDGMYGADDHIAIFTDPNARIPELDGSDDNPFVGTRKSARRAPQRRSGRRSQAQREADARIDEAVRRDEGVAYVFRGKRIFRRFSDADAPAHAADESEEAPASDGEDALTGTLEQHTLRQQAGATAQRPLTRSAIKPRLLFPSEEQLRERDAARAAAADEEAATDIDVEATTSAPLVSANIQTPVTKRFVNKPLTPPTTVRATRARPAAEIPSPATPALEEDDDDDESDDAIRSSAPDTFPSRRDGPAAAADSHAATLSPFAAWQRVTGARKRAGEAAESDTVAGAGKRSRGLFAVASPRPL